MDALSKSLENEDVLRGVKVGGHWLSFQKRQPCLLWACNTLRLLHSALTDIASLLLLSNPVSTGWRTPSW